MGRRTAVRVAGATQSSKLGALDGLLYSRDPQTCRLFRNVKVRYCKWPIYPNGRRVVTGQKFISRQSYEVSAETLRGITILGLQARVDIPSGSYILPYAGIIRGRHSPHVMHDAGFVFDKQEQVVDAVHVANETRFINHSCNPNTVVEHIIVDGSKQSILLFVTQRDVKKGDFFSISYCNGDGVRVMQAPTQAEFRKDLARRVGLVKTECRCLAAVCGRFIWSNHTSSAVPMA